MGIVTKTIIGGIPSTQITFLRFLIGGLFLLPVALYDLKKKNIKLSLLEFLSIIGLGILNVAISMNLGNIGLLYNNANISAVLFGSNPIYVGLFASLFLHEKLNLKTFIGLFVGLFGVFITFSNAFFNITQSKTFFIGVTCSIAGAIIYAFYTVIGKRLCTKIGSLTYTSLTAIFGSLSSIPIMLVQGINPIKFDLKDYWLQLAYISIVVTALAFYCYFKVLETESASLASMVFFFKPLLVMILSAIILQEKITVNLVVGVVFVLIGVKIAGQKSKEKNEFDAV